MKKRLTHAAIASAKPRAGAYSISDGSGLAVLVGPGGTKSFVWYCLDRITKKRTKVTIGRWPEVSLEAAGTKLEELKEAHRAGRLGEAAAATGITVDDLAPTFMQTIDRRRKRPEVVQDVLDKDVLPMLGGRLVASVTAPQVAKVVESVVGRGSPAQAGRVLQVLRQFFQFAQSRGYIASNPAATLNRDDLGVVSLVRDRVFAPDEIRRYWQALDSKETQTSPTIRDALRLLLLVPVRTGELRLATWEEFDLDGKEPLWIIPVEHSKMSRKQSERNAKPHRVPLAPQVVTILRRLKARAESLGSANVLASEDGKGNPLNKEATPATVRRLAPLIKWNETDDRGAKQSPGRPHDCRRTIATGLAEMGVAPHVVEHALGHTMPRVLATYNKHDYLDEQRIALNAWAEHLDGILAGKAAKVVSIRKAAQS